VERAFVGRDDEEAATIELLQRAKGGHPQPLLIVGEQGSGKTTMMRRAITAGREQGFRPFVVEADLVDGPGAYAALRHSLATLAETESDAFPRPADLAALDAALASGKGGNSRLRHGVVSEATTALLDAWTFREPVLFAFDDLHATDAATGRLVAYLLRHARHQRLFVVATTRPRPELSVPIADELAQFHSDGQLDVMTMSAFDERELEELVVSRLGRRPTPFLLEVLRRRTGGMPFFAAELLDALIDAQALSVVDDHVDAMPSIQEMLPRRVTTAVLHRVFRLGADARRVASAASLLDEVSLSRLPLLERLSRLDPHRLDAAFDRLVAAHVLVRIGDRYRFSHAIVRDALYDDLGPAARRRWHGEIARTLSEQRVADDERATIEIAQHLRRTGGARDSAAASLLVEAGDAVLNMNASAAADWYRDALGRLAPDDAAVADTQLRLSRALDMSGRHADATRVALAALRLLPPGPERAAGAIAAARTRFSSGDFLRAGDLLDAAIADATTRTSGLLLLRAHVHHCSEQAAEAGRCLEEARVLGIDDDDRPMEDLVLMHLLFVGGRYRDASLIADSLRRRLGDLPFSDQPYVRLSLCLSTAYNLDPALAIADAREVPDDSPLAGAFQAALALGLYRQGRLADAIVHAERARAAADPSDGERELGAYMPILIAARATMGDLDGAERARRETEQAPFITFPSNIDCAVAHLSTIRGDHQEALRRLEQAEQREVDAGRPNVLAAILAQRAATCLDVGDTDAAEAANRRLQALSDDDSAVAVRMHRLLTAAEVERDPDAAQRAHEHASRYGLDLDAARALATLGSIKDDATLLVDAHAQLERTGDTWYRRKPANELRRIGRHVRSPHRSTTDLTSVEIEVAQFVAQGLTNRQVAREVHLSPKTIEVYLSRIYAKTGRRSRVELAVAVQAGLLGREPRRADG
jgi:DNA-binding CsgD family transcriptional regulator/tetratricopeptide (TPR) repeat protein